MPLFLLDVYGKDEKDNLSAAEKNALKAVLSKIADAYRASVRVATTKRRSK